MISVYPAFYKDFRCKADRCVHSCCMQNWDIDIDEATAMKYLVMTGEPGETIRASMTGTKGNRRFIMKDGRCPLLQEDGLCRIVAETGEENLCDICAMHPRFFVENGNFELAGVGLACEESVKLLLSNSTPLLFMEDSAPSLFDFPTLLSAMGCSLPEEALSYTPTINETYCRTILHALSQTEPVDEAWTKRLSALSGSFTSMLKKASSYLAKAPLPELTAVYQYIFYRALEKEPFCGIDAVMTYARQSTDFIFMETAVFGDLPENIRRWSEQIEYDTDNTDISCRSSQNNISAKKQIPLKDLLSFSLKTPFLLREKFHKVFLLYAPKQKEGLHSAFHRDILVFHTCFANSSRDGFR